jgi:FAD/FMN-containing dehydrogenase
VYAAIKRAISDNAGVALEQVRAASRLRDVLSDPERELRQIMRNVASDLGGPEAAQVSPSRNDSVRDVMRTVQDNLRSIHSRTLSVAPQTELPEWLVDFAREAAIKSAAPPDAQALSLQVGVPLRQMQQALDRIGGSD